ncbi:LLM class flavin-dependent oxidoreductase [Actinoplanes oblitus]|uniref:LLM class flavin-dependent oxidoreductase n=1 Tax=Actinoplanes oblitus TaxID=3040509 RepID=A0ABY8W954_9ACTN|nr:LLM class flavin-dependent oxidoreductase [Actinoplanes oblitus]WIM94391.1 LLM class flavin-dependent oxidoreductase [Actinoplanes oblitus]
MRFGVFFELQLPKPWTENAERDLFHEALEQAECADRIGVDYLWAQEHHFLEEYSHSSAPEVFLAACSQRTSRIRLGHGIALMPPGYNHPARVAEKIAALDLVSNGRVEWGTGESSSRVELEGFGLEYAEKRAMWAEATRETARMMACTPYPGHQGRYFSMPVRNIVPKPVQRPHPPLWMACSNREALRLAARLGVGALTFAFMDHREARYWVEEYYEIFDRECVPIGLDVNPNVAMLCGFSCGRDGERARALATEGQQFFAYGLSHYFRTGTHRPGTTELWDEFAGSPRQPMAGMGGIGSVEEVTEVFAEFEDSGVDQVILLQQGGRYRHPDVIDSLELFGAEVLPAFRERAAAAEEAKAKRLADAVARARERIDAPAPAVVPEVEAYPSMWQRASNTAEVVGPDRSVNAAALWRLHAGRRATGDGDR